MAGAGCVYNLPGVHFRLRVVRAGVAAFSNDELRGARRVMGESPRLRYMCVTPRARANYEA